MPNFPQISSDISALIGGPIFGGTSGSVLFVDGSGNLGQDNANFFWDNTNKQLGLGTSIPAALLHVAGNVIFGSGEATAVPANAVIRAPAAAGANIAGSKLTFRGGSSTGNAVGGSFAIETTSSGAAGSGSNPYIERISITGGTGIIINDIAADYDMQIKGISNQNLFFLDASADSIGMGTSIPKSTLHIVGKDGGALGEVGLIIQQRAVGNVGSIIFMKSDNVASWHIDDTDGTMRLYANNSALTIRIGTGGESVIIGANSAPLGQLDIRPNAAGTKGIVTRMAATPTANPFEIQTSAGILQDYFYPNGALELGPSTTTPGKFRVSLKGGTNIATTDVALSAGWGAGATVSSVTGNDSRGTITVSTNALDVPTGNPTVTLTFKDLTWTAVPFAVTCMDDQGNGPLAATACHTTVTTLVITYIGTPTSFANQNYTFNYVVIG